MTFQRRAAARRCSTGENSCPYSRAFAVTFWIARPREIAHVDAMRLFLASLIGAVLANAPAVMACEGCKEPSSVAGNGGVDGISFGFSASVIFMLVMVGGILGGFSWMAARSCRQLEAAHRAAAAQTNWSS